MSSRSIIRTDGAPAAIGTYSQAVRHGNTVYLSGQLGLDPVSMTLVEGVEGQIRRAFDNLQAIVQAAGGELGDLVRLTVYLTDLAHFGTVNSVMGEYFQAPYPARAAIGVASLPRGGLVEIDGILILPD